jgi:hypothetical protein
MALPATTAAGPVFAGLLAAYAAQYAAAWESPPVLVLDSPALRTHIGSIGTGRPEGYTVATAIEDLGVMLGVAAEWSALRTFSR